MRPCRHLSLAVLALTTIGLAPAAAQTEPTPGSSTFVVTLGGVRVGTERVTVSRSTGGWLISATGQLASPFNLQTNKFEVRYAVDWHPQSLTIDARLGNFPLTLATTFGLTTATSDLVQGGQKSSATHTVSPRTIVLPSNFFAAYEALAARLGATTVGARIPVFVVPSGEIGAVVDRITPRFITTPGGDVDVREFDITFGTPSGPLAVQVWIDSRNRLVRVFVPAAGVAAVREDLATVMAREEKVRNPGDDEVLIPGNGFNMAGTITKPAVSGTKAPAVILVAGAGPEDRDYSAFGVAIFGRLAGALAEAGYFVVRYDKRGVGQSGGRIESARLSDYAEDVKRVVQWVRRRDDVDRDRVAVIGYDEGAAVALAAADIEGRIRAVALLAATSQTGFQATLAEQERQLARSTISEVDKEERRAIQRRMLEAARTGTGWEAVPDEIRQQADTAWFRSWIEFDPARAISRIDEPILIVHGELDRQIPAAEATRLEALAREKEKRPVEAVIVPGVNHLLVPATTGEVDEYAKLDARNLSAQVIEAVIGWLRTAFNRR